MNEWVKLTDTAKSYVFKVYIVHNWEGTEIIKMATEAQGNRNSKKKKTTIKMKYVYWSTMKSVD